MVVCIFNSIVVNAMEIDEYESSNLDAEVAFGDTVYYDGVKYNIEIDAETSDVVVTGETDGSEGTLVLSDGEASIEIENDDTADEFYELAINDLSENNVDVTVYNESGSIVEVYDDFDEIVDDVYEEQVAATSVVLYVLAAALLVITTYYIIVKSGVTYVIADHITKAISKAKSAVKKKARKYYYPAVISKSVVYIDPHGINKNAAALMIASNGNVYSYTSSMASSVITSAGYVPCNEDGIQNAYDLHKRNNTTQFKHYHRGKTNSKGTLKKNGKAHSLFGNQYYF